jgi:hypothetical protein
MTVNGEVLADTKSVEGGPLNHLLSLKNIPAGGSHGSKKQGVCRCWKSYREAPA